MYIQVTVQRRKVNFFIDTDSTTTVINVSIYEQMYDLQQPYLEQEGQQMKWLMERGVEIMDIMTNDTKVKHTVSMTEIDKEIDGILGSDFLQRHQLVHSSSIGLIPCVLKTSEISVSATWEAAAVDTKINVSIFANYRNYREHSSNPNIPGLETL
ncbi:hypothetical protein CHS0354_035877 [Potamilus streckersoni]|uniref:Uncharacterized protein n=1 Tax=Potamilus streckersoni TaxID=2493646 RepID=A0AAE0RU18_9BIVA|nr:hypothetical protein CHS0354_035877 [Potamilus streckersoni]